MIRRILSVILISVLLSSCAANVSSPPTPVKSTSTANPTAKEVLSSNKDADIFMWNSTIYINAIDNEWVHDQKFDHLELIGEITKQFNEGDSFDDGTATQLPLGTKIYTPSPRQGAILIVKRNNQEMRYLGLIEG